jgi:hypothetical protein
MLRVLDCKRLPAESVHIGNFFDGELCKCMPGSYFKREHFDVAGARKLVSLSCDCDCILYFHII